MCQYKKQYIKYKVSSFYLKNTLFLSKLGLGVLLTFVDLVDNTLKLELVDDLFLENVFWRELKSFVLRLNDDLPFLNVFSFPSTSTDGFFTKFLRNSLSSNIDPQFWSVNSDSVTDFMLSPLVSSELQLT